MFIDWNHFTALPALTGGVLIGLAVVLFALFNGQVAGVSGIVGGLMRPREGDTMWRLAFIAGLIAAPLLYQVFAALPEIRFETGSAGLALAGLLVGIGTQYGSGCTSGHGVCGLSRLSPRSLVATLCFMLAGFATVYVVRHLVGG
ncbi:MAG TPA: YeeE/YedE family protein [Noviherbaspirillum sp.]|uniref:YeeE/YedE family protein n=1 Tax=Noviherbaspirillum sp. TaxID=1926288 RepID=UPI002B4768BE|nr:YeeE/YedE family protein [Noviherbaspirillum sp.]HJV86361.1 YeeE/YedE family protein [Noviherbaspirillum sp.]